MRIIIKEHPGKIVALWGLLFIALAMILELDNLESYFKLRSKFVTAQPVYRFKVSISD